MFTGSIGAQKRIDLSGKKKDDSRCDFQNHCALLMLATGHYEAYPRLRDVKERSSFPEPPHSDSLHFYNISREDVLRKAREEREKRQRQRLEATSATVIQVRSLSDA